MLTYSVGLFGKIKFGKIKFEVFVGKKLTVKGQSHCSDNENDDDHDAKRTHLLVKLLLAEHAHALKYSPIKVIAIV